MNRLMSMLTQRTDSESGLASTLGAPGGVDSPRHTEPADVAVGPGHGLVVWSIQVCVMWVYGWCSVYVFV